MKLRYLTAACCLFLVTPTLQASAQSWSNSRVCTVVSPSSEAPRVALVVTTAAGEDGKVTMSSRVQYWLNQRFGTEGQDEIPDVTIEIPGQGRWTGLKASERSSGKTYILSITIPDDPKVAPAFSRGGDIVVSKGEKSFSAKLAGSGKAIADIATCMH